MSAPKIFLSAALLVLLCACGPPTSSDPAAKEQELVLYQPSEDQTNATVEDVQAKMTALRTRLLDLVEEYPDYDSVASGETDKTEQRAGGTERMQNLPERGANVGQTFDSITAVNRDLLGGARYLDTEAEDLALLANTRINNAKAALSVARVENEWTDEEVKVYEAPILAAESALQDLTNSRMTLQKQMGNGEDFIMEKRENTPGTPNQN